MSERLISAGKAPGFARRIYFRRPLTPLVTPLAPLGQQSCPAGCYRFAPDGCAVRRHLSRLALRGRVVRFAPFPSGQRAVGLETRVKDQRPSALPESSLRGRWEGQ